MLKAVSKSRSSFLEEGETEELWISDAAVVITTGPGQDEDKEVGVSGSGEDERPGMPDAAVVVTG